MSTSPESAAINTLSRWLAGHVGNEELRGEVARLADVELGPDARELLADLRAELQTAGDDHRGEVDRLVRETLEALAYGA
jgi:hypothetical protein